MILIHLYKDRALTKEIDDSSDYRFVCTTNNVGSFFLIGKEIVSRFQGLYFNLNKDLFKILENIEIEGEKPTGLFNSLDNSAGRVYENIKEKFRFVKGKNIFIYQLSSQARQFIFFDPRRIFEYPEFGRHFTFVSNNSQAVILRYDYVHNNNSYTLFIGLKALTGDVLKHMEIFDEWIKRDYPYDRQRNSLPDSLYTCKKLSFISKGFLITAERSLEELVKNLRYKVDIPRPQFFDCNFIDIKKFKHFYLEEMMKESIARLKVEIDNVPFFYAGLPWFIQFWTRDEAISLEALFTVLTGKEIYNFLKWRWQLLEKYNFFPTFFNLDLSFSDTPSYDGTFTFLLNTLKALERLDISWRNLKQDILKIFFNWLDRFIDKNLRGDITSLFSVPSHAQWMDSLNERSGSLIEIEALFLSLLKQASLLTSHSRWSKILDIRKKIILKTFFNGSILADRANCFNEIRPNIFLVYYFFPELFNRTDWEKIIDKSLENLWLEWGGLTTITKTNPLYKSFHTGENPLSYHNGDSWFFLNAIGAYCFLDFKKHIFRAKKIYKKLISDFLWFNCLGFASELSGAQNFKPQGSPIQLWSICMLLKLMKKLKNMKVLEQ